MTDGVQHPNTYELIPIGIIHSPYKIYGDAPRQGRLSDTESIIEIFSPYTDGLCDLEEHKHLIVLYWLDHADRTKLTATPPHTGKEHGVFATRSPSRPNPIGFAVADLMRRESNRLIVRGLDAFDKTPVLDVKPYFRDLDCVQE